MVSEVFCGGTRCEWGRCDDCLQTANCVALVCGVSVEDVEDLGGFGCQGTCGGE